VATFIGKMDVASSDIGNCTRGYIFAKGYHHLQKFSRELEKINNSRTFSFVDFPHYTR